MKKKQKVKSSIFATGKRKTATAVVELKKGKGEILINKKYNLEKYFPWIFDRQTALSPVEILGKKKDFDLKIKVSGGGKKAQVEAIRLGLSRALVFLNPEWHNELKAKGFLTRDSRIKERKKPGLKRARRAPQWTKR